LNSTTATLKPVSRTTLSEQVAMQLSSELTAKRWKPGEKLPSEAELCQVFHVGRSTLREALKSLAFIGMIRMRAGGGSYVAEQGSKYMQGFWLAKGVLNTEKDLVDFSEARLVLETELAALCTQRATDQDIDALEGLVTAMEPEIDQTGDKFSQLDLAFHLGIAAGSKNEVLLELLKNTREVLLEFITKSLLLPAGKQLAYAQHGEILEALKQRDRARARKAMRAHLRAFQRGYKVLFQQDGRSRET
jgi:GntR family transcriptional regulator, transcriptional repressor for pyruvate dehydrogenase complex